jgi:hypothetical protein
MPALGDLLAQPHDHRGAAVIVTTMIESVKMLESGMTGWVQLPNSCPRSARATMPVDCRIASAIVR